jgi:CPA2 family monovalent cation:H+ antiporter-2
VLLGVPLSRVVKRIRSFREERYKIFKGYFRGASDMDSTNQERARLHSIEISKDAYAKNLRIDHIDFAKFNIEVQLIRRPNMLEDIAPRGDIMLADGDVLVLYGSPKDLIAAEIYLITGK